MEGWIGNEGERSHAYITPDSFASSQTAVIHLQVKWITKN